MPVFDFLYGLTGDKLKIYTGTNSFQEGIKLSNLDRPYFVKVENAYYAGRKVCIQRGVYGPAVAAESTNLTLNPRILTSWLIARKRKALGKPVVMWGHAWPREGKDAKTDRLRQRMRGMADLIVTYTESQAAELGPMVPGVPVMPAPNALYTKAQMTTSLGASRSANGFVYVGRFVESKKPGILLRSFAKALPNLKDDSRLYMVGDGPQKDALIAEAKSLGIADRVDFPGWISSFDDLRPFYMQSVASVSPGYMGLAGTQSFAFGVPMIISKDEPHAPEIEATEEGRNAIYFETDSEDALASTLIKTLRDRDEWTHKADSILQDCMERYSVDVMATRLANAFEYRVKK